MDIKHSFIPVNVSVTAFDILVLSQTDKQKYLSVLSFSALIMYLSNDAVICPYVMVLKEVIYRCKSAKCAENKYKISHEHCRLW